MFLLKGFMSKNAHSTYQPEQIEPRWQQYWLENKTFRAENGSSAPKFYALDMFPYPSGAGLHIGHPEGYTATDIVARYKLACGYNVLHPMGWDAFGLPAEQYAIKTGTHPSSTTRRNIENFRGQIQRIGFAIDWDREVNTTDPAYYRWTQWIFLQLFKRGLVFVDERPVWWCPELKSVLANEEVIDGKSEVGGHPVERRNLKQVVLRITAYAARLLDGLEGLDWPDSTKRQQKAWIGRSEGASIRFALGAEEVEVFTTRPDTLAGATYLVLAPEHPLVEQVTTAENRPAVEDYVRAAARKSDLDRTDLAKEKTGCFTGAYAINPLNGEKLPVWIADYVLVSYGTGAIMAVPAHDERDYEFAQTFGLPVREVIRPSGGDESTLPFTAEGVLVNSGEFSGLGSAEATRAILQKLGDIGKGRAATSFRLRDWIFSRQRYWGEPMPMIWVEAEAYEAARAQPDSPVGRLLPEKPVTTETGEGLRFALPVPEDRLPLELPPVETFQPAGTGESPLATVPDWLEVWVNPLSGETCPRSSGRPAEGIWYVGRRETNTMPQWAGSCWYYLRYMDPHCTSAPVSPAAESYWQGPDLYIGGNEHAVLHLLYARFWHHVLYDAGVVSHPEPFRKLFHQGLILGEDGEKMSKSRGNVINPDEVIGLHGADALRLFEMFLGPLEETKPWNPAGIEGITRFLRRVWREVVGQDGGLSLKIHDKAESADLLPLLHESIAKVTRDIENLRFNTAISQLMILVNQMSKATSVARSTVKVLVQMLAPFAPHLAEELWQRLGETPSVARAPWPQADETAFARDTVHYAVQVNGKVRAELVMSQSADKDTVLATARGLEKVIPHLAGKTVRKEIFVPGKIVNFVVG